MRWESDSYLIHFGIKGQKWGLRRFQNEDGTLTEEGKRRYQNDDGSLTDEGRKKYLAGITSAQRNGYNALAPWARRAVDKELARGRNFGQALAIATAKQSAKGVAIGAGMGLASLYATNPAFRQASNYIIKSFGKRAISAIKNSNAAQKGSLFMQRMMRRKEAVKNGAIKLKKSQYSVRDYVPKFGGYLRPDGW